MGARGARAASAARADELTPEPQAADPAAEPDAEREAQERLACLLRWIAVFDAEFQALHDRLPAPPAAEAEAMEDGERPESLAHSLRTAIECARHDWLPRLRAVLDRAATLRQSDLDLEWARRQGERRPEGG